MVTKVVKDTVHISQKAKEAFHEEEKKAEQVAKHVVHEMKQVVYEIVHPIVVKNLWIP
ncbi:MAG: hypothetical protein K6T72_17790 [Anoxybacillus sp.]|nr:hypothetical protein [Anoxybacillus sp.]MCL6588313.1 hypothetical protein [Anoxybacillus sp.]